MDCAARYGGDEFIILLPEVRAEWAVEVAERIRQSVSAAASNGGRGRVAVTVSIGVAVYPDHGETPEAIIASADKALYHAKRNGRNRVVIAGSHPRSDVEVSK
jgi:diguanylate cyclase (GGDEF)-like protein